MERVCLIRTARLFVVFYPDTLRHWSRPDAQIVYQIINNKQTDLTKLQNHNEQIQVLLSII